MKRLPLALRHSLVDAACTSIAATRADRWLSPFTAGIGIVLTLHRVRPPNATAFAPNAGLEITPDALVRLMDVISASGLEVIAIDDVLPRMRQQRGRRFIVLTFDDGYRDNLENAAPILNAKGVPWTIFVVTDFLRGQGRAWWLELESLVASLDTIGIDETRCGAQMPSRTLQQKNVAFETLRRALHGMDNTKRSAALERLRTSAALDFGNLVAGTFASADEVLEHTKRGTLTIGSHTTTHGILSRCTLEESAREILESKIEIETLLGQTINHIAFPHGDKTSVSHRETVLAATAYSTAWTTHASHLHASDVNRPWALPRISLNGRHQTDAMFRALLSGAAFPGSKLINRLGV
jgi:peptidoglycan/xylan/chitin deacetylase (PgdA/CDA1 family)